MSGHIAYGAPTYDFEIWLASALLSVTFPFLMYSAAFFNYWPLGKQSAPERAAAAAAR